MGVKTEAKIAGQKRRKGDLGDFALLARCRRLYVHVVAAIIFLSVIAAGSSPTATSFACVSLPVEVVVWNLDHATYRVLDVVEVA